MSLQQRRERERASRHELIVESARELAESEGWEAVTIRRLAERIEYSQPVLYSHFAAKNAIVAAVAVRGFAKLAEALRSARAGATTSAQELEAAVRAYVSFGADNPAVYDAMFVRTTELPFAQSDAPEPLQEAFGELRSALSPFAASCDLDTVAEVSWAALHGLITLSRSGRLRPRQQDERITLLIDELIDAHRR